MACQFGPHTVRAHAVSPIGDRMLCVTPPYGRPGGGFTAVGLTISSLDAQLYSSADADAARGRAVVSPRGAQGFEYTPTWITRAARPSESDANGGAVLTVVGAHLQTAGACAFGADVAGGVRLAGRAATHVVSSALIRCEVPKREVGDGSLTLASETPEEDAARRARGWGAPALAASPTPYDPEDEVPGLALTAVRVPVVSDVTVGDASDGGGAATITMWGAGFDVGGSSRAAATGAAAAAAASEDDADAETETRAPPRRNAGGCRVGTTWVAAATTSRVHASCVIPWRAPSAVRVPVAYHDMRDHATGGAVVSSSSGENAFTFNPQSAPHALALVPSAAPTDGDTIVYVFGELGMGGGGASTAPASRRDRFNATAAGGGRRADGGDVVFVVDRSARGVDVRVLRVPARPRLRRRAEGVVPLSRRRRTRRRDAVFAYARAPVVRRLSPAEGGGVGGEPIWISGADLHLVGDTRSPSSVLCLVDDRVAVPARVVSSALASCERPRSASTGGGGSGRRDAVGSIRARLARDWVFARRSGVRRRVASVDDRDRRGTARDRERRRDRGDVAREALRVLPGRGGVPVRQRRPGGGVDVGGGRVDVRLSGGGAFGARRASRVRARRRRRRGGRRARRARDKRRRRRRRGRRRRLPRARVLRGRRGGRGGRRRGRGGGRVVDRGGDRRRG